jgi:predicted amidohydrolase
MVKIIVSAIQFSSGPYKMTNLNKAQHLIEAALKNKDFDLPHLICLPEVFNFRSSEAMANNSAAEDIPGGHTFNWASQLAKELKIWLIAGSILEKDSNFSNPFNTCFVVNPEGKLIARYRKINLFQLYLDNSSDATQNTLELCEPRYRQAGKELISFEIAGHKIGLAICFDLRFPEVFVAYRQQGCELIILPAAFTYKTGQAHWETLCKARAIENQSFFVAANQSIEANCWGHSLILGPWGETLASMAEEQEGFIQAEIDFEEVKKVRERLPLRRDNVWKLN